MFFEIRNHNPYTCVQCGPIVATNNIQQRPVVVVGSGVVVDDTVVVVDVFAVIKYTANKNELIIHGKVSFTFTFSAKFDMFDSKGIKNKSKNLHKM